MAEASCPCARCYIGGASDDYRSNRQSANESANHVSQSLSFQFTTQRTRTLKGIKLIHRVKA